jgi:hypothetical protein
MRPELRIISIQFRDEKGDDLSFTQNICRQAERKIWHLSTDGYKPRKAKHGLKREMNNFRKTEKSFRPV